MTCTVHYLKKKRKEINFKTVVSPQMMGYETNNIYIFIYILYIDR